MSIKIRHIGTSDVLTVPKNIKKVSREYEVFSGRGGAIVYLPKQNNPFKDDQYTATHLYDGDNTGFVDAMVNDDEL